MGFKDKHQQQKGRGTGTAAASSRMSQADDEQVEGFEQEADAFELPPPIDDGKHLVEVKIAEGKDHGEFINIDKEGNERKHFHLPLVLTVIGKSDPQKGRVVFDYPNTMPTTTAKGVTTKVATLIRQFGGKATGRPFSDITILKGILSKSTPKRQIVTRWTADYDKETKAAFKEENGKGMKPYKVGQANFPEVNGIHIPLTEDNEGRPVRTGAQVVKYEAPEG